MFNVDAFLIEVAVNQRWVEKLQFSGYYYNNQVHILTLRSP